MRICFSSDENRNVTAVITGTVGITECELFRTEMQKDGLEDAESLTLDLSGVPYVTSSGLREFLTLKKRMGQKPFRMTGICDDVYQVLEMTGFSSIMDCEKAPAKLADYAAMSFRDFLAYKVQSGHTEVVIQDSRRKCTWADIDRGASNIASDLAKMGVRKGTHVAICSANSVNWLLTFFAVQKLGGIAILINYKAEIAAISDIADAADVTCFCYGEVLSAKDPAELIDALIGEKSKIRYVYDMRADRDFLSTVPEGALPQYKVASDDVALMIFTSGSTGRPKAVMLTAYNLLTSAANLAKSISMTSADIACVVSPMFHISGIGGGTFTNLIVDARIVLPPSVKTDVILNVIEQEKCTIFNCVPTIMLAMIHHPDFTPEKVQSLRYSKLSGAPITKAQFLEITQKTGHIHLGSSYGMTEIAPITSTLYGDTVEHITETVGRPVEDVQVRVVDLTTRADCPPGVQGEILARGNNLLTGYYKLDAQAQPMDEDGWMCTGDLGYFSEDGYLHFTGRLKNLIIRGGENISPGEIASVLTELPEIADAVAFGIPDEQMGELVGAAVCLRDGAVYREETIRAHAEKKLAKYKWPTAYVCFDSFPHLSNGKVDGVKLKKAFLQQIRKG